MATRATTCSGSSADRTVLLDEKPVVRNDAIMMYSPYLEEGGTKINESICLAADAFCYAARSPSVRSSQPLPSGDAGDEEGKRRSRPRR